MRHLLCALTTTEHMGNARAHYYMYPQTKFRCCSPYWTLDICLFVISQWEQICKWAIEYVHSVMTHHVPSNTTYQVWWKLPLTRWKLPLPEQLPYIQTAWERKSGSSSTAHITEARWEPLWFEKKLPHHFILKGANLTSLIGKMRDFTCVYVLIN